MSFTDIDLQSYTPSIKISRKFGLLKSYSKINSSISETKFIVNVFHKIRNRTLTNCYKKAPSAKSGK